MLFFRIVAFGLLFALAACQASKPPKGVKIGKPYEINGKTYYPEADAGYDKTGDGSWYGPGFHGKRTASGERFNENDVTAAHPTLPMPSIVRVTNLKNNRSVIVRINDRGPFHSNRIIDLSKKSAQMINMHSTMPVRVEYLEPETEAYLRALQADDEKYMDLAAYNGTTRSELDDLTWETAKNWRPSGVPMEFPSPDAEIIETTLASKSYDENVSNVAPVTSIESSDIAPPKATARKNPWNEKGWANDNVTLPTPAVMASDDLPSEEEVQAKIDGEKEKYIMPLPIKKTAATKTAEVKADSKKPTAKLAEKTSGKLEKPSSKTAEKTTEKVAAKGSYTILAGSFSSEANAKKLVERLKSVSSLKIAVSVEKVAVSGKDWWRVHAGPFSKKDTADKALKIVQSSGVPDARIIQK